VCFAEKLKHCLVTASSRLKRFYGAYLQLILVEEVHSSYLGVVCFLQKLQHIFHPGVPLSC